MYMTGLDHLVWMCTRARECNYAYSLGDGKPLPDELDTNEAKKLLKMAADFDVENLFITGGEPMLRTDFLELMKYASDLGLEPYIQTNGWHIDEEVAQQLASLGCRIIISIAGLKDVDDMLRGEGAYHRSINAATLCGKHDILYALSVVNTRYAVNQIQELVNLALSLGAKSFSLASLIPQPICVREQKEKLEPFEPSPEEREREVSEIYALNRKLDGKIHLMAYDMFHNRILKANEPYLELESRCSVCSNLKSNHWLEIHDDGTAYGCSPLGLKFGDIRKDSLEEIMERVRQSEIVKKLADKSNLKGKCGVCDFNTICGGCRARAYILTGDMFASDPACPYAPKK